MGFSAFFLLLPLIVGSADAALNCTAPNATLIPNAQNPPCAEGLTIQEYYYCTPLCSTGYTPDEVVLNCFPDYSQDPPVATLHPPTFFCDAAPCSQPRGIVNASEVPCKSTETPPFFPAHTSLCIAQCENGFKPTVANLTCLAAQLYPETFECTPLPCVLSSYNHSVACQEPGDIFFHGQHCTPSCPAGHASTVPSLECVLGNMTPPSYSCYGLPCPAPNVSNAHPDGSCLEADEIPSGGRCTAQCGDGYEPWCGDESGPRSDCQLECFATQFNSSFVCKGRPCESPGSGSIENSAAEACAEGPLILHNTSCTPQCQPGYEPNVPFLECSLTHLLPPTFECLGLPCSAPVNIPNAGEFACKEGPVVEHGSTCMTSCAFGYIPDVPSLGCVATVLSPASFSCLGLDCVVPTDIANAATPACNETLPNGNITDGMTCTAQCLPGFEPLVASLPCRGSVLRPSTFKCVAKASLEQATFVDEDRVRVGITRNLAMASLDPGSALLCYRDVGLDPQEGEQGLCSVVVATTAGVWRGKATSVLPSYLASLAIATLATDKVLACYRDDSRAGSVLCKLLGVSGFGVVGHHPEVMVSEGATWHLSLAAADLGGGPGAVLCYQRGSSACACRTLREGAAGELLPAEEARLDGSIALALATAGLAPELGVVCLTDGLRARRAVCRALSPVGAAAALLAPGAAHEVSEGEAASLAVAALGMATAVVCFTDAALGEEGRCRLLDVSRASGRVTSSGPDVTASVGLTRHLVLSAVGPRTGLLCYQVSESVGEMQGRCRVLTQESSGGLGVGDEAVVNAGRTWNVALAGLFADTALACFTDTSEQEQGKCLVLWGPWRWMSAEARVCRTGHAAGAAETCVA